MINTEYTLLSVEIRYSGGVREKLNRITLFKANIIITDETTMVSINLFYMMQIFTNMQTIILKSIYIIQLHDTSNIYSLNV